MELGRSKGQVEAPLNPGGATLPLLSRYDRLHRERYEFATRESRPSRYVDFGCGYGPGTNLVASETGASSLGLDIDPRCISYANRRFGSSTLRFRLLDDVTIPAQDGSVDLLTAFEVLEHLSEPHGRQLLSEARRVLATDGLFIGSTPNAGLPHSDFAFHLREYSPAELIRLSSGSGLSIRLLGQGAPSGTDAPLADRIGSSLPQQIRRTYLLKVVQSLILAVRSPKLTEPIGCAGIGDFNESTSATILFVMRLVP